MKGTVLIEDVGQEPRTYPGTFLWPLPVIVCNPYANASDSTLQKHALGNQETGETASDRNKALN